LGTFGGHISRNSIDIGPAGSMQMLDDVGALVASRTKNHDGRSFIRHPASDTIDRAPAAQSPNVSDFPQLVSASVTQSISTCSVSRECEFAKDVSFSFYKNSRVFTNPAKKEFFSPKNSFLIMSSLGIVNPRKRREIDGVSGSSMVRFPSSALFGVLKLPHCDDHLSLPILRGANPRDIH